MRARHVALLAAVGLVVASVVIGARRAGRDRVDALPPGRYALDMADFARGFEQAWGRRIAAATLAPSGMSLEAWRADERRTRADMGREIALEEPWMVLDLNADGTFTFQFDGAYRHHVPTLHGTWRGNARGVWLETERRVRASGEPVPTRPAWGLARLFSWTCLPVRDGAVRFHSLRVMGTDGFYCLLLRVD